MEGPGSVAPYSGKKPSATRPVHMQATSERSGGNARKYSREYIKCAHKRAAHQRTHGTKSCAVRPRDPDGNLVDFLTPISSRV